MNSYTNILIDNEEDCIVILIALSAAITYGNRSGDSQKVFDGILHINPQLRKELE